MPDIKPLLNKAHRLLLMNPRDGIHDLSHHQRVWGNAKTISKTVGKEVNEQVMQVAVMWHDVMISSGSLELGSERLLNETVEYLDKLMERLKYEQAFKKSVLRAIRHHNFLNQRQMSLEGKILFDADKLDALNPARYRKLMATIRNKQMSKIQIKLYARAAKVWLKTMRGRYHFEVSRQMHNKLVENLLKDEEAIKLGKELGVDIAKLVN